MVPALRQCLADQVPTSNLDLNRLDPLPSKDPMRERNKLDPDPSSDPIPVPTCLHARFLPCWQSHLVLQDLRPLVCRHYHTPLLHYYIHCLPHYLNLIGWIHSCTWKSLIIGAEPSSYHSDNIKITLIIIIFIFVNPFLFSFFFRKSWIFFA